MGNIARADDLHPFQLRPFGQVFEGQILAGGAGIVGVEVEVGDQAHDG